MTWRAAHQSPDGVLNRFTFASREPAAMALYTAMSRCGSADAWGEMRRLAASTADFIARIDGHWFALSRGDTDWAGSEMSSDSPCVVPSISGSIGARRDGPQTFPAGAEHAGGGFSINASVDTCMVPLLPEERMEQIGCMKIASISTETFGEVTC